MDFAVCHFDNFNRLFAGWGPDPDPVIDAAIDHGPGERRGPTDQASLDIRLVDTNDPVDPFFAGFEGNGDGRAKPDPVSLLNGGIDPFGDGQPRREKIDPPIDPAQRLPGFHNL